MTLRGELELENHHIHVLFEELNCLRAKREQEKKVKDEAHTQSQEYCD